MLGVDFVCVLFGGLRPDPGKIRPKGEIRHQ